MYLTDTNAGLNLDIKAGSHAENLEYVAKIRAPCPAYVDDRHDAASNRARCGQAAGYDAVELRRTDFERCYDAGMSNERVLDLIKKSGIPCGVLGVKYGWLFATGEESKRLFKVFRETCENAVALRSIH